MFRSPPALVPVVDGCPRLTPEAFNHLPARFVPERISGLTYAVNVEGLGYLDGASEFLAILPTSSLG